MRQRSILALVGVLALVLTPLTVGVADQAFHTQRLSFSLTAAGVLDGHPELRSGHVVDIHANGPKIGALERYMINGAKPNTSYQVVLAVSPVDCGADPSIFVSTATLATNAQGNAHGQWLFTPDQLAPLAGLTFGIRWTLVTAAGNLDIVAYQTPCIVVAVG